MSARNTTLSNASWRPMIAFVLIFSYGCIATEQSAFCFVFSNRENILNASNNYISQSPFSLCVLTTFEPQHMPDLIAAMYL